MEQKLFLYPDLGFREKTLHDDESQTLNIEIIIILIPY